MVIELLIKVIYMLEISLSLAVYYVNITTGIIYITRHKTQQLIGVIHGDEEDNTQCRI